ncbi:MAG: LD-carboxypeptidase [Proteobacteria bacterium]|nr:LD-carboxypeptidase [Pseudomonadota bacterium]
MKYKRITKGSTIGLISPSSPPDLGAIEIVTGFLKQQGFKVKLGRHITKEGLFSAGSDQERAEDVMRFFLDTEVDALMVTRGGVGSITILPLLDFDAIYHNPKPIIGFSDTTALQLGIHAKTQSVSITGFGGSDIQKEEPFVDAFLSETLNKCLNQENYTILQGSTVNPGTVTAPLIGGNLMSFVNLMGTPFQPKFRDTILLFEEVLIEPYIIEGMLSQLYVSGVFEQVSGIIIGSFTGCESKLFPEDSGTIDDIINDWSHKIKVPCIRDFPYGHTDSRCVLPLGHKVTLDATNCTVNISFDGE